MPASVMSASVQPAVLNGTSPRSLPTSQAEPHSPPISRETEVEREEFLKEISLKDQYILEGKIIAV